MNTLTVFTPSYNRINTLVRLYDSLLKQTCHQFTWIIVDDGSTDETSAYVPKWKKDSPFQIKYYYQENSGKSMAHNRGVDETETDLFVCVDSDDELVPVAVETIIGMDLSDEKCVGVLFKKGLLDGTSLTHWEGTILQSTLYNAYSHLGLTGDTMLVYKTNILKKYKFPSFEGEKFIPESYLYDQIDQDGYLIFSDKILYLCEYLPDGLSANMRRINANNPRGYISYIEQRIRLFNDRKSIVGNTIRLTAMKLVAGEKNIIRNSKHPFLSTICYLPSVLFYYIAYRPYVTDKR